MTDTPAHITGDRPRAKTVPLEWPVEYAGKVYDAVTLVRLTAGDVIKFSRELETALKNDPDAPVRFPIFKDDSGAPIPDEVLDALDDDDRMTLDEAAVDFLPRRFRALAAQGSTLETPGDGAPMSGG
jgi:hypothetical protein